MGRRRNNGSYVNIAIPIAIFNDLAKKFPELEEYRLDYRYSEHLNISIRVLTVEQLTELVDLFRTAGEIGPANAIIGYLNIIKDPSGARIGTLKRAEPAIVAWIRQDAIRGWIFRLDTELPELVVDVTYHEGESGSNGHPAYTKVSTKYWAQGSNYNGGFSIYSANCAGQTVSEIMLAKGYLHEDKGLHSQFAANDKTYIEYRDQVGMQFVGDGARLVNDFGSHTEENNEYGYRGSYSEPQTRVTYNNVLAATDDETEADTIKDAQFTKIPIHPFLWCFDLKKHSFAWHYIRDIKPYKYNPGLRDSLILPESHSDLIDALTKDIDIVAEDIIEGKSGGITILCQGRPGTGKTLTAEVYAEIVEKPLYRVHSGQLGTEPEGLEKTLVKALERAERWGAILLIDEADVFLMQRTDDLVRNAVVGVFLRTLEYYKGLLFLTTNRLDAIDDAIVSRCIAVIKYENPGEKERRSIWATQFQLNGIEVPADLIIHLAHEWNASGRDIKGLVKLTTRYCNAHNKQPEFDDFRRMATFRGMS